MIDHAAAVLPALDSSTSSLIDSACLTQLHTLMTNDSASIRKAGQNVFRLEPRIGLQQIVLRVPGRELSEDVLHGEAMPTNDRLAAKDPRVECDPLKKLVLPHDLECTACSTWSKGRTSRMGWPF